MEDSLIKNALTFDVEEYFQVSAFENVISRNQWETLESRVEYSTNLILDLLESRKTKATFFTLGMLAEKHPSLVQRIIGDGHELGCHGYEHTRITQQTVEEFRADIRKAKQALEDISGVEVIGYRAASFSINRSNFWAFDEISEAGFKYSSSVYPVRHDLYGIPDAPRFPFKPKKDLNLLEIPITTFRLFSKNFPAGGGGYFRLYPYAVTKFLISRFNAAGARSANMYFHPWEFDPDQPRPTSVSLKTKIRHYINQDKSLQRLENLLGDFSWGPMVTAYSDFILGSANGIESL